MFPELSVLDNILSAPSCGSDATDAEIEAMLEWFPRLPNASTSARSLPSGGEQQMLALARGLMTRPRLLLLDQPSLGLAPVVINELFAALDRLRSEAATILLVDQKAGLALTLADRAYVIEGGRIVARRHGRRNRRRGRARAGVSGRGRLTPPRGGGRPLASWPPEKFPSPGP